MPMPIDQIAMYFASVSLAGFFGCFMVHMVDEGLDAMLEKNRLKALKLQAKNL